MSGMVTVPIARRPGRPPCCSRELAERVVELHRQGLSLGQICAVLNVEGVPTPTGKTRWLKSSVDRLLHTRYAQEIIEKSGDG